MNRTSRVTSVFGRIRQLLADLLGLFAMPEPPKYFLTGRQEYSLRLAIEQQLGPDPFLLGCFSCVDGAGASTVSKEIAHLLGASRSGDVALLSPVWSDMSEGTAVDRRQCVQDFLRGDASLEEIAYPSEDRAFFQIDDRGRGSMDVHTASRLEALAGELRERFAAVVIDLPPMEPHPDTLLYSRYTDGMIMVLESEVDRWESAQSAKQAVESSGGKLIGAVINKRRQYVPQWLYRVL